MTESRAPSHSIVAEESVIGCLLSGASIEEVSKIIDKKDFYSRSLRLVFDAIKSVTSRGHKADIVLITDELEENQSLEDAGGFHYISEIWKNTSSTSNCIAYAEVVKRESMKRALVDVAQQIQDEPDLSKAVELIQKHADLAKKSKSLCSGLSNIMQGDEGYDFEVSWVIKNYVPAKSLGMIYGPGGSYKSFMVLDWAASIANGKDWAGNRVKKGGVLYIAGEGQSGIGLRVKAWNIINRNESKHLFRTKGAINITDADAVERLVSDCRLIKSTHGCDIDLIVLDTVNRCFGDGDENSTQDMTKFVAGCDKVMSETGAGIICVHHSGKDVARGARGSSVLRNAMDYEYSITRTPTLGYTLKCTKAKEFEEPVAQDFALRVVETDALDEDEKPKTSLARVGNGREASKVDVDSGVVKLIDYMRDSGCGRDDGLNIKFLKEEVRSWFKDSPTDDAKRKAADRLLAKAADHGYVVLRNGFYYLYEASGDNAEWGINEF